MQDQHSKGRLTPPIIAAIASAVLLAGGGAAWYLSNSSSTPKATNSIASTVNPPAPVNIPVTPAPTAIEPTTTAKATQQPAEAGAKVYWLKDTGTNTQLVPVPVSNTKTGKSDEDLKTAFNTLLNTPASGGNFTTIPQGTKLNSVSVKNDGVHLDLSPEFTSGGGSATMIARLAQVLYTATSNDNNAQVWLSINGKPLDVIGGEGLVVPVPLTRKTFEKDFSQ